MNAINRILYPGAILAAGLLVVLLRLPHLLLAASLASGQLDGRQIPVINLPPREFPARTQLLPCGDLRLAVPVDAIVEPQPPDESTGFHLKLKGLECRVPPPRYRADAQGDDAMDWNEKFNRYGIDWQASVCAINGKDLSFWMSPPQVESLRQQLEAKMYLSLFAERIEVVRNKSLSGLLLMWGLKNQPRMRLEYFTPDHRISGTLLMTLEEATPQVIDAARALVSGLRVEYSSDHPDAPHDTGVMAASAVIGRVADLDPYHEIHPRNP